MKCKYILNLFPPFYQTNCEITITDCYDIICISKAKICFPGNNCIERSQLWPHELACGIIWPQRHCFVLGSHAGSQLWPSHIYLSLYKVIQIHLPSKGISIFSTFVLCQKLGCSNTVYTKTRDKKKLFSCLLFNFQDLLTQQTFDSVCIVGRMSVKKCSPQTTIVFVVPTLQMCDAAVRGILPNTDWRNWTLAALQNTSDATVAISKYKKTRCSWLGKKCKLALYGAARR